MATRKRVQSKTVARRSSAGAARQRTRAVRRTPAKRPGPAGAKTRSRDVPQFFRLNVEVGDLNRAAAFYGTLLGVEGRRQAGARCYFTCGAVTLQVVDVARSTAPHPAAKALYFTVRDLDAVFARARTLGCLSGEDVHGTPGGEIAVRPWGERSFYAEDPWANPLCFVEAGTVYAG